MGETGNVLRGHRLLHPVEVVPLESPDPVDGGGQVPGLVRVDPEQRPSVIHWPPGLAHRGHAGLVVAGSAADLQVEDAVTVGGEPRGVPGERLRIVALEEAEVVELVVDGTAEEGARGDAERPAKRIPARDLDPGEDE